MENLYIRLLRDFADGLLATQYHGSDPRLSGGFLCPACKMMHGRSPDAVYPLLYLAKVSGEEKYLTAARAVFAFGENFLCRDGGMYNDAQNTWRFTTVFHAVSVGDALRTGAGWLDDETRAALLDRLRRMADFLFRNLDEHTYANINYPTTGAAALAMAGHLLGKEEYLGKAAHLAAYAMAHITENGFLFGEGKPHDALSPLGCRAIDVGYNMEESLPSLVRYAREVGDEGMLSRLSDILRRQLVLMLPDGAWDNSFGCRNNKWTYYGSRTSDGCATAYLLLADRDPAFAAAARRNTELLAACTHGGLLYGGPHYRAAGVPPCVHHTFEHACALAYVAEHAAPAALAAAGGGIPADHPAPFAYYPEVNTYRVAAGDYTATVTGYDHEVKPGCHASGGTLTLLHHRGRGAMIAASVVDYRMVEPFNMQQPLDIAAHRSLVPRLVTERAGVSYTTAYFTRPEMGGGAEADGVMVWAKTGLADSAARPLADLHPDITYCLRADGLHLTIRGAAGCRFVLPLIAGQATLLAGRKIAGESIFFLTPGFRALETVYEPDGAGVIALHIHA